MSPGGSVKALKRSEWSLLEPEGRLRAAHYFPLLLLLGGIQFGVIGKEFFLPIYVPLLYLCLTRRRVRFALREVASQDLWVGLFCFAALLSLPYATDLPKYAYGAFCLFFAALPAYWLGRRLAASRSWSPERLQFALIGLGVGISVLYLAKLALDPLGFSLAYAYKQAEVGGMRSNMLVSLHVFALAAAIEALRRAHDWGRRVRLLAVLIVLLVGGLSLNSRAYLVLMGVVLLAYLVTGRDRGVWVLRSAAALGLIALLLHPPQELLHAIAFRWTSHAQRLHSWRDDERVQIWGRSLEVWEERPLFGHGLTNSFMGADWLWAMAYREATAEEIKQVPAGILDFRPDGFFMAHNTILQLLIEVGVLGAAIFLVLLARFLAQLLRLLRAPDGAHRMLAATLLWGTAIAFLDGLVEPNFLTRDFDVFFFFLLGVVYSAYRRLRESPLPAEGLPS